jgi:hypothetical protein
MMKTSNTQLKRRRDEHRRPDDPVTMMKTSNTQLKRDLLLQLVDLRPRYNDEDIEYIVGTPRPTRSLQTLAVTIMKTSDTPLELDDDVFHRRQPASCSNEEITYTVVKLRPQGSPTAGEYGCSNEEIAYAVGTRSTPAQTVWLVGYSNEDIT